MTDRFPQKRRKTKQPELPPPLKEKMKKAYNECYQSVLKAEDENGRRRCDLFKELPDKRVRLNLPRSLSFAANPLTYSSIPTTTRLSNSLLLWLVYASASRATTTSLSSISEKTGA